MLLAVPLGVEGGVLQPEVGRQVHDQADPRPELGDDALGLPVGQAAEDQVEPVEAGRVAVLVDQSGIGARPATACALPTCSPAWEWAVATATSKSGCPASRRNSSDPV